MIRIFAAFPLPLGWQEAFLKISGNNGGLGKFRWTPPGNLHITLFFIGEVEEKNLESITRALKQTVAGQPAFSLHFDSIELRGKKSHPSMLWGKFRMSESFATMSDRIYRGVKEFMTIAPQHKDPIPHCTLARIKPGARADALVLNFEAPAATLEVNATELWQTQHEKEGVRYERLARWELEKDK
jgi:2'-5' RNA ligase